MRKNSSFVLTGLAGLLMLLSGCQKNLDLVNGKEVTNTPLPGQTTYCRIESIWENPGASDQRYLLILYDEFENPVAITTPVVSTGHPYRTFKYDSWHRLREYRGEYANGHFEFWHFYGFDLSGRIGVDTMYTFGELTNGPINYFERTISKIEYDSQNRIIKVVSDSDRGSHFENIYTYDGAGNLVYPASSGVTYDSKVNLHRTNDYWMFLARDYSKNNPFVADAYNSTGFPTIINSSSSRNFPFANTDISLNHSQIGYNCRPAFY